ncbi:hypothetical protein MYX77_12005, partial [Acidobacteriia bacterium AH_259_A11_L15]|nr:hypothetical protein [Acidobacteriia bacterium AH_259_A11_L15]
MTRRFALLLVVFLVPLLSRCSKSPSGGASEPASSAPVTFLAQGKVGALKIVGVDLAPSLSVSSQDTADKLHPSLRPANPAETRNVVLELTIVSETLKTMLPLSCGDFVLTYDSPAGQGSAPCVGLSFGDQWILATSPSPEIKLIYNELGETREEK